MLVYFNYLIYCIPRVFWEGFFFSWQCPENCTTFTLLSRLFIEFHCVLFCIYRTPSRCWVATPALPPCTRRRTQSVWGPTPSRPPWNTPTWTTTTVDSWNLPANWAKIWQWNVLVCNLTQMRKRMNKWRQLLISQLAFNQVERRNICWEWYHSWFTTSMFWILVHTRVKGFRQKFKVQFKECVGKTIEWELTEKVLFILLLYRTYNETCTVCSRHGRNIFEVEAKNVKCLVLCIISREML